jgi:hypothetical protein
MSGSGNSLLEAALAYAELGYAVFPCEPNAKRPCTAHGFKDATTDAEQIERWWAERPDANVGLATQGLLVVDVDAESKSWPVAEGSEAVDMACSVVSLMPHGGRHYVYRQPTGKSWACTAGKLAPGVDTRATGGYIVVPPSVVGGKRYRWADHMALDRPLGELSEPPQWLVQVVDRLAKQAPQSSHVADNASGGNPIPSGCRNDTLMRLAGTMRRAGMTQEEILAALRQANRDRCKPPLSNNEVEKIAASVSRYAPDERTVARVENPGGQMSDEDGGGEDKLVDPGPFPEHLLSVPGLVGDVMSYCLETAHKPQPVLALGGALSLQAVLAARKVRDPRGNRTNLYVIGVAESGRGKDRPRKVNRNVLFHAGLSQLEGNEEFASDSGLLKAVEMQPAVLFQLDEVGRMLKTVGDATRSHLYHIATALMKLYSSADTVFLGKAYADHKRSAEIILPCVSLYGTTTPDYLFQALQVDSLEDGFLARLLIFETSENPPRRRIQERPVPQRILDAARWWGDFRPCGSLDERNPQPAVVEYTEEAWQTFDALARLADAESAKGHAPLWARAEEKACRLALVYACSAAKDKPLINGEAATWACDLSLYLTRRLIVMASQWIADGEFDAKQKKVLRLMASAGGKITQRELVRKTRAWPVHVRMQVLENMEATRYLRKITEHTGGRPKTLYVQL